MRKYEELSQEEKEHLDENELDAYIRYELMELGSTPEPIGPKPKLPIGLKIQTFYQIGGFLFKTPKDAEKLIALRPSTETYDYNIGYNVKFAKEREPEDMRITVAEFATAESVMEHAEELAAYNSEYDVWESKKNRNDRYENNRLQVIKKITNDFKKIQELKQDRTLITKTFEEYKTLAINEAAALKFLVKTFGKARVTAIGIEVPEEE